MKKRSLISKILVIANALGITAAFVGCPGRKDPAIVTIAPPPPGDLGQPKGPPKEPEVPFVTIAPYGGNLRQLLPPEQPPTPASPDSRDEKRSP